MADWASGAMMRRLLTADHRHGTNTI